MLAAAPVKERHVFQAAEAVVPGDTTRLVWQLSVCMFMV
jgi:hypothetical protein